MSKKSAARNARRSAARSSRTNSDWKLTQKPFLALGIAVREQEKREREAAAEQRKAEDKLRLLAAIERSSRKKVTTQEEWKPRMVKCVGGGRVIDPTDRYILEVYEGAQAWDAALVGVKKL